MALTTGLSRVCEANSGGLKALWLCNAADLSETGFTVNGAGEYNAMLMESGKAFFKFEFKKDTAEYRENGAMTEGGSFEVVHEIEIFIQKLNKTNRNAIAEIIGASYCGMIGIVELTSGAMFVVGYSESFREKGSRRPLEILSDASLGGKMLGDLSGSTIILQSKDNEKARVFTGTIDVTE